jgi:hypothetical protein
MGLPDHWKGLIEKDHLGAWDLVGADGKPRDFTLEIVRVESKVLKTRQDPKGKRKAVITFARAKKAFVSNSTNCETIAGMYGNAPKAWIGKLVTLYATKVRLGGEMVDGIRVRPAIPKGRAEQIEDRPVDEEMRAKQVAAAEREPGED